jgi:hypothetical protein
VGVRVRYNHFGAIARALPRELDKAVKGTADDMAQELKGTLWEDTGKLRRVTTAWDAGPLHAEVHIGYYLSHGFYSGFQEFGTVKQAARPIVTPTAHRYERVLAENGVRAIRRAVTAR